MARPMERAFNSWPTIISASHIQRASAARSGVTRPAPHRGVCRVLCIGTLVSCLGLGPSPIEPEVFAQIKNEILDLYDFATLQADDADTTVLTNAAGAIGQINIPMNSDNVRTGEGEDVLDTDLLDVELDFGILGEEFPTPLLDGGLTGECTTGPCLARVHQHSIVTPS
jgi:hypothetical protein